MFLYVLFLCYALMVVESEGCCNVDALTFVDCWKRLAHVLCE